MIELQWFKINRGSLCVFSVYAAKNGNEEECGEFYDALQKQLDLYNNMDHIVIAGDINIRVGNQAIENFIGFLERNWLMEIG